MLNLGSMPDATREVFDFFYSNQTFEKTGATLLGGTALSLKIGHRLSEDLDFFFFREKLPKQGIKETLQELKEHGFHVENIISQAQVSQARINGIILDDLIQEYAVNGVKLSFGVMSKGGKTRQAYFASQYRKPTEGAFSIPEIDLLFESKAVVLMDRVKSRDLYDLMVLMNDYNYDVSNVIDAIQRIDGSDEAQALSVCEIMTGIIPIDNDDPGFDSIDVTMSMDKVYQALTEHVNKYEQDVAAETIESYRPR